MDKLIEFTATSDEYDAMLMELSNAGIHVPVTVGNSDGTTTLYMDTTLEHFEVFMTWLRACYGLTN